MLKKKKKMFREMGYSSMVDCCISLFSVHMTLVPSLLPRQGCWRGSHRDTGFKIIPALVINYSIGSKLFNTV